MSTSAPTVSAQRARLVSRVVLPEPASPRMRAPTGASRCSTAASSVRVSTPTGRRHVSCWNSVALPSSSTNTRRGVRSDGDRSLNGVAGACCAGRRPLSRSAIEAIWISTRSGSVIARPRASRWDASRGDVERAIGAAVVEVQHDSLLELTERARRRAVLAGRARQHRDAQRRARWRQDGRASRDLARTRRRARACATGRRCR